MSQNAHDPFFYKMSKVFTLFILKRDHQQAAVIFFELYQNVTRPNFWMCVIRYMDRSVYPLILSYIIRDLLQQILEIV